MPLAKHWIRTAFVVLLVLSSTLALAAGRTQGEVIPKFPEYAKQTVGDAIAEWTVFHGHKVRIATSANGPLRDVTTVSQLQLMVSGNHDSSLAGSNLKAGDLIGVVVYPLSTWPAEEIVVAVAALLVGVLAGWWAGVRSKRT